MSTSEGFIVVFSFSAPDFRNAWETGSSLNASALPGSFRIIHVIGNPCISIMRWLITVDVIKSSKAHRALWWIWSPHFTPRMIPYIYINIQQLFIERFSKYFKMSLMKCNGPYITELIRSVITEKGTERCKYHCIGKIRFTVGIFLS